MVCYLGVYKKYILDIDGLLIDNIHILFSDDEND